MSGGFAVPFSSSPPSTPPGVHQGRKISGGGSFPYSSNTNLSTTPAGPPPSSAKSFTPAGPPPPSSYFGSSQPQGRSLFEPTPPQLSDKKSKSPRSHHGASPGKHGRSPKKSPKKPSAIGSNPFVALSDKGPSIQGSHLRSPGQASRTDGYDEEDDEDYDPQSSDYDSEDDEYEYGEDDEDDDDDEEGAEDGSDEDVGLDGQQDEQDVEMDTQEQEGTISRHTGRGKSLRSSIPYDWMAHSSINENDSSMSRTKRMRSSVKASQRALYQPGMKSSSKNRSGVTAIAKGIARQLGPSALEEPDDLILDTESQVIKLYPIGIPSQTTERIDAALRVVPDALSKIWQTCCNHKGQDRSLEQEFTLDIGPGDDLPSFHRAVYAANLLLKLYHPPPATGKQAFAALRSSKPFGSLHHMASAREEAYPKVLLQWLDNNHDPYKDALANLRSYQPSPTAHIHFWTVVYSATLRGKLSEVIDILLNSDFAFACTAKDDGQTQGGYQGQQLETIQKVIKQVAEVLRSCPGVQDGDWYVSDNDWLLFRRRVESAVEDLTTFAEGEKRNYDLANSGFEASNFGLKSRASDLTQSTRRAESKVPWTVYQNIKTLYGLLLGGSAEIISCAQDWLEASIALAVWWDGDDEQLHPTGGLSISQSGLKRSRSRLTRLVDNNTGLAYRQRLQATMERVTDEAADDALQINTNNPVEVAIAAILDGDMESIMNLLQAWSAPIAAAVVEIASQAGWYESAPGIAAVNKSFDESDLMVLSYGQTETLINKDSVLTNYAELLASRDVFTHSNSLVIKEWWELAVDIFNRLDDTLLAKQNIGDTISQLQFDSDHRADKMINICRALGLEEHASEIADRYANVTAETTDKYGTALIYYARSHNPKKVKDVLDLLISYCLVQSAAFPPMGALDVHLNNLLTRPRDNLMWLAESDPEASEILASLMGGYATLRKFYDLRDEGLKVGGPSLRPLARKKAAVNCLLTVVDSAADNIQGGLYDPKSTAVVPVDGLLVLLGEAMMFVDQQPRILTLQQILVLLRAIEDFQTVHSRIQSQCNDCLSSTLASSQGTAAPAEPRDLMRKSISDLTASSGFSLVGSSMLGSTEGKGKDGKQRGWDWRIGVHDGAGAQEIIAMLRVGLARDVSKAWMDGEEV